MGIKTLESMSGFIASDPVVNVTEWGATRMWVRVGQEHHTPNPDGSFTAGPATFHDLVMFRRSAERAAPMLRKGDRFIAEGHVHRRSATGPDGEPIEREEFVARRIGHDNNVVNYQVDRTPRRAQTQTETRTQTAERGQAPAGAGQAPAAGAEAPRQPLEAAAGRAMPRDRVTTGARAAARGLTTARHAPDPASPTAPTAPTRPTGPVSPFAPPAAPAAAQAVAL